MIKQAFCLSIILFIGQCCQAEWITIDPIQSPAIKTPPILEDISSQTKDPWRDPDLVTTAHELTHMINSRIRNSFKGKYNGYYVLKNVGYIVKEPKSFKLKDLAAAIKQEHRGQIYQLYLIQQQQYFQDEPAYIMDEWTAYTNGTMCGIEIKDDFRTQDSGHRMLEMAVYATYLKDMAKQEDISEFVDWQIQRNIRISDSINMTNPKMLKNYQTLKGLLKNER